MSMPSVLAAPGQYLMRDGRNGTPGASAPSYSNYVGVLTPANTRTGNPIGRPSNATLAARQAAQEAAIAQGLPIPQVHTARTLPRGSRQSSTPVPPAPPAVAQMKVYYRAPTFPEGPLPLFVAPPGQPTIDATLVTPARSQGMYSTYPSRMRTGVTSLVQPEIITGGPREREAFLAEYEREMGGKSGSGVSTPRFDSPAPRPTFKPTLTGRRARAVNYVDKGSDEDSDSSLSDIGSEDDDNFGRRGRAKKDQPPDMQTVQRLSRLKRKKDEMDKGWTWLGDRTPGDKVTSQLVRPANRHRYLEHLVDADTPEVLIPITIDLDVAGRGDQGNIKIRDRFLWNVNADNIGIIAELIRNQVEEAQALVAIDIADTEPNDDDITFEEDLDKDEGVAEDEIWKEADCRVILNIDLQISTQILRDRIEWDLCSTLPPTTFAAAYTRDLGLSGEATPLIAHAITEEILRHKKDALDLRLFRETHPDQQAKWEKTSNVARVNNRAGAKELKGVWRDWFEREEFGPVLLELSLEEMERREVERNREQRRIMRGVIGKRRR